MDCEDFSVITESLRAVSAIKLVLRTHGISLCRMLILCLLTHCLLGSITVKETLTKKV